MQILNCVVQLLYQILFKNASGDIDIIEKDKKNAFNVQISIKSIDKTNTNSNFL